MYRDLYFSLIQIGGGEWIRTTESEANGFTVRPLWPTRELLQAYPVYLLTGYKINGAGGRT